MTATSFAPAVERRAALDRAHRGDVEGAWGTLPAVDAGPRNTWKRRLRTLLAVLGPGVIVMAADNDAGGVALYAQAGQDHHIRLLGVLAVLTVVLFINQEMVGRLGAVTGAGHAKLIFERFGPWWGRFALADLVVLNELTLVTEFIGLALGGRYFGLSKYLTVPVAAAGLIVVTARGSFRGWERAMCIAAAASMLGLPLLSMALARPAHSGHRVAHVTAAVVAPSHGIVFLIALVGTTVAPWQLFFHQSNVVDKRLTSRWVSYGRADTALGCVLFGLVAVAIFSACALMHNPFRGHFVDAGHVATALRHNFGAAAGGLFAAVLLNGSLLGAGAVTLSTSYAIGDATGLRQSLHRSWRDARAFHGSFVALTVLAMTVVLIPNVPFGLVTVMVSVLAGVLLPSATVFLLMLCNDRAVLGPWVNPRWLNVLAGAVVSGLVALSGLLILTTLFPALSSPVAFAIVGAISLAVSATIGGIARRELVRDPAPAWVRLNWTMPALHELGPRPLTRARTIGLAALRAYLVLAAALVVIKAVQLAT